MNMKSLLALGAFFILLNLITNSELAFVSEASAGSCAESTADTCSHPTENSGGDNCRGCNVTTGSGNVGSPSGTGSQRSGSSGSRGDSAGDRDNNSQEDNQEPQNRAQCISSSETNKAICYSGPLQYYISTVRSCNNHDFSATAGASGGFRIFSEVNGSATVTVRNYDQCVDVAEAVRDGVKNDCDIAHFQRVERCPAN